MAQSVPAVDPVDVSAVATTVFRDKAWDWSALILGLGCRCVKNTSTKPVNQQNSVPTHERQAPASRIARAIL